MKLAQKVSSLKRKLARKRDHIIVVSSAHRVGSTWVFNILKNYFELATLQIPEKLRKKITNPAIIDLQKEKAIQWLAQLNGKYIIKSHTKPPSSNKNLEDIEFITVIRDPRDLMISSIYYLSNLEAKQGGWPWLNSMAFRERMFEWLKKNELDYSLLSYFHQLDYIYKFYYEKLLVDEVDEFLVYLKKKNHSIRPKKLKTAIAKHSFENMAKRNKGKENIKSFYRKGVANDWKNYFDWDIKKFYKTADNGKWNQLLIDLGYEKDSNW